MRHLHVIMLMDGEGSRFLKEGGTTPELLIELNGQPLFKHAISSVTDKEISMKCFFIVHQEYIYKLLIYKGIKSFIPKKLFLKKEFEREVGYLNLIIDYRCLIHNNKELC